MNKVALFSVLIPFSLYGMLSKISDEHVFKPHTIRNVELYHGADGFQVHDNGAYTKVQHYNVDKTIRTITPTQLAAFHKAGKLRLNKADNGEYIVRAHVGGEGGGVLAGGIVWFGVQVASYTALFTGVTVANTVAPGTGTVAAGLALTQVGGMAGYVAGTQALAAKAGVWALLCPFLP